MKKLRSQEWFGRQDKMGFVYRSWMKNQGRPHDLFDGRPVIGICNTWSELTPCNGHFRELADFVKRGVWEAGGFPLEFPVMSLGETQLRPTAMLFRNLASMDVEESIRGNPMDGVVLLMGCDKTTPSLLMGAASCDLPTIGLSGGPMLSGKFHGHDLGSGTGVWQMCERVSSGEMKVADFFEAESCMHRSKGHCIGHELAWKRGDPGRRCTPQHSGPDDRAPHCANGPGRSAHVTHPDTSGLRECDSRQRCHRRVH
jgi:L-arabonate dehydrase